MKNETLLSLFLGFLGITIDYLFGGFDVIFSCLILFMIVDTVLGYMTGALDGKLKVKIAINGGFRKIGTLGLIVLAVWIDKVMGTETTVRAFAIFYYIALEGLSILEHGLRLGIKIPNKLKTILESMIDKEVIK